MLIIVGLLAFGRVFFYWIEANHVASETARWAIVDRNPYAPGQTLQQHARDSVDGRVRDTDVKVCIDSRRAPHCVGDPLR